MKIQRAFGPFVFIDVGAFDDQGTFSRGQILIYQPGFFPKEKSILDSSLALARISRASVSLILLVAIRISAMAAHSKTELLAMLKNLCFSLVPGLPVPSAMLSTMLREARSNWSFRYQGSSAVPAMFSILR